MDSEAFRQTYREISERHCVFEKGILTNQCGCSEAEKFCIAEREGVRCRDGEAQAACVAFLDTLRQQARFALKTTDRDAMLPHAKAIRLQIGGLRGVASELHPGSPATEHVPDVRGLLRAAAAHFGGLDLWPFARIMQQIAAYQGRRRRRERARG